MKKFLTVLLLLATSPCFAQTSLVPKGGAARADVCAPIGKTARGELVYSIKCDNMPAPPPPPAPPPQAATEPPPPARETARGGLFGWSYDKRE